MSIRQEIEFKIEHRYFAGFLQHAIDETGIVGSVRQEGRKILLLLDESSGVALKRFESYTKRYLPHSIFLGEIHTEISQEDPAGEPFRSPAYPIAPCPICLEMLTDPASDRYLDDGIVCTHYANDEVYRDEDFTTFSPHFNGNDTVLLTDAGKIRELFVVTDEEIKALFSIEKPTLRMTVRDEGLRELTGRSFLRVKAPYNIKSALAALNAKESGIDTLFFNEREGEPELILVQEHRHMIRDNRISAPLEPLEEDPVLNRFRNVMNEAGYETAVGAYLSRTHGISFPVATEEGIKRAIRFQPFKLRELLERMEEDERRGKLLANFRGKFPAAWERLERSEDLFGAIAAILELKEGGYDALRDESLLFHGNGGLKIDMNFSDEGFDYVAMLGSIMSFRIAGVESHYLAYSIFEAYGDMVVSVLGQLKRRFKIDRFILLGDLFDNSVLFSRILSKFQIARPYFSERIALDAAL